MTDKQWAEIIVRLQKSGCEVIVPQTGQVLIREKANLGRA